ncbi:MAG: protease pro-enzyme activation domain-containing protein [Solirubrobacterales bacterium]
MTRPPQVLSLIVAVVLATALAAAAADPGAAASPTPGDDSGGASAAKVGPELPSRQVDALISLRHPRGLNRFVRAVSNPVSPRYRRYANVSTLVRRFGAPRREQQATISWLRQHGARASLGPTGTYVQATLPRRLTARLGPTGPSASASRAASGRRVPLALRGAVSRIDVLGRRPATRLAGRATAASTASGPGSPSLAPDPATAPRAEPDAIRAAAEGKSKKPYTSIMLESGAPGGCADGVDAGEGEPLRPFTPRQYLTAYGHAAMHARGFDGSGETVAVVETDGFRRSDVETFAKCFGFRAPPTRVVPVGIGKPLPPGDETTLDLEMLSAGAPGLERILVYEGLETERGVVRSAGAALGSPGHRPDAISISLGICEPLFAGSLALREAFDSIFAVAAGAGISVLVSAGDTGSSGCRVENAEGETTALPVAVVSLPSSSPYVTAVGGTNLHLSKKNRIEKELVWNDLPIQPGGGGGGASILTPHRPWWQTGIGRYRGGRAVPDIAALADIYPGYAYFCTAAPCAGLPQKVHGWTSIGGTSAAAPLMTAGVLIADQYAAAHRQPPLGFLNPLLYRLGANAKTRRGAFFDVTDGHNDLGRMLPPEAGGGQPLGCCHAAPGYDLASGWGSLKIAGFARLAAAVGG